MCTLQLGDASAGAVFVLLRCPAADTASTLDDAIAHNRNGPLAHDHVPARGGSNTAWGRLVGALGQLAARPTKRRRRDGLALAAIGARPDCVVHALKRDQTAA